MRGPIHCSVESGPAPEGLSGGQARLFRTWFGRLAPYWPVLAALLVLAPRLLSPELGLLDDAVTIHSAREVAQHPGAVLRLNAEAGRFVPAYWLYYTAIYAIAWAQPFMFFLANLFVLAGTAALLIHFMLWRGSSRLQAGAAGLLFVLSGPVIENFYTFSKAEPLQVAVSLAGLAFLAARQREENSLARSALFGAAITAFFLAFGAKETSIALIPISVGWFLIRRRKSAGDQMGSKEREVFAAATAIAGGVYFLLRWTAISTAVSAGTYTRAYQIAPGRMLGSLTVWLAWLVRDFPYLAPLALFIAWTMIRREQTQTRLLGDALIWMAGWMVVFLPWQSTLEYYLLPFAVGCAVFGGVALGQLVERLRRSLASRWLWAAAVLTAALLAVTQVNNSTSARFQMMIDEANADLLTFLSTVPANSTVLINLRDPHEYVYEIGAHLADLRGRPDVSVGYFRFQAASPDRRRLSYYVATPVLENQLVPAPRAGFYESGAREWGRALRASGGTGMTPVYQTQRRMRVVDLGLHRLVCPFLPPGAGIYCSSPRPLVDTRSLVVGWRVYRVSSDVRNISLPGVFCPDGAWSLRTVSGSVTELRFGKPGDLPLAGDWNGDGRTEIGVFRPSNLTWYLDRDMDGKADVEVQVWGMQAGDIPVTGDWDGDGVATPGYFRPSDASWRVFNDWTGREGDTPVIHLGMPGDTPIAGDWQGNGHSSIGVYRRSNGEAGLLADLAPKGRVVSFGVGANGVPVVGDWAGQGVQSIALVRGREWSPKPNCNCEVSNPAEMFEFDAAGGVPVAGKWRPR